MFAQLIEAIRLEARSERSAKKKARQLHGLLRSHPDKMLKKVSAADAAKTAAKLDDPKNKLAPQFVHSLRKDVHPDRRPGQSPARQAKYRSRVAYDWQKK